MAREDAVVQRRAEHQALHAHLAHALEPAQSQQAPHAAAHQRRTELAQHHRPPRRTWAAEAQRGCARLSADMPAGESSATLRRVHAGESIIQPSIATRTSTEFSRRQTPITPAIEPLSERERDVLCLLADGLSTPEIATRVVLAEGTTKNHVSVILDKLHAANRTQAARMARDQGLS